MFFCYYILVIVDVGKGVDIKKISFVLCMHTVNTSNVNVTSDF